MLQQALHIFRKDIRHLWPELVVYFFLLAVHAQASLAVADRGGGRTGTPLGDVAFFLNYLVMATWLVLTARAVQDEAFIGSDRFWLTRPYHWSSLLLAKLMFVVFAVLLPHSIMQVYGVFRAGMHPLGDVPGMLLLMVRNTLHPLIAFLILAAAVTATIGQAFLLVVGMMVTWAIVLTVLEDTGSRMAPPYAAEVFTVLMPLVMLTTMIYQYRQRDTARTRVALGCIVAVVFLFGAGFLNLFNSQAPVRWLLPLRYQPDAAVTLRFDPSQNSLHRSGKHEESGLLGITLPIRVDGLPPRERLYQVNTSFHLDSGDVTFDSPWRSTAIDADGMTVLVPKGIWDRVGTTPVHLRVAVVATRMQPGNTITGPADGTLHDEEGGLCRYESQGWACHWAFRHRSPLLVQGMSCFGSTPPAKASGIIVALSSTGATWPYVPQPAMWPCHGSNISLTSYHASGGVRMDADLPPLLLRDFRDR